MTRSLGSEEVEDGSEYGFQLRDEDNLPTRQAMFSLLREAFVHELTVIADYLIEPGKRNGTAIRVALIRQPHKHHIPPTAGNVAGNVA